MTLAIMLLVPAMCADAFNFTPTSGYDDEWGYWYVCCTCGRRIEGEYHYYNHYDGEDHDDIDNEIWT